MKLSIRRRIAALPVLCALTMLAAPAAQAQQAGLNEQQTLNAQQTQGRQLFAQSCGICHLHPVRGSATYGPPLSRAATAGNDDVMRALIVEGSERMPAFKYYLKPNEIDAIIAYLRTVPAPATSAQNAQK